MDPAANLDEQLQLANRAQSAGTFHDADHERLVELVLELRAWTLKGGFLPGYVSVDAVREALQAGHENDSAADQVEFVSDLVGFEAQGTRS